MSSRPANTWLSGHSSRTGEQGLRTLIVVALGLAFGWVSAVPGETAGASVGSTGASIPIAATMSVAAQGSFQGRIVNAATGAPVHGATVSIEGTSLSATTDLNGAFVLPRAPRESERLRVRAESFVTRLFTADEVLGVDVPRLPLHPAAEPLREHVVVTATRTETALSSIPGSVTVLDRQDLLATPSATLADALEATVGIHGYSAWGNPFDVALDARGFTGGGYSSYYLVLVDGVPLNDLDSDLVDWNQLPLDRIQRVEIQRGVSSSLYGDSSLAGVIHLFTGPNDRSATSLSASGGSFGEKSAWVSHSGSSGRFEYDISASRRRLDGYRDRSAWTGDSLNGQIRYSPSPRSTFVLSMVGGWLDNETPGPLTLEEASRDRTQAAYSFDEWDQNRYLLSARYTYRGASGTLFTLGLSQRQKQSNQVLTLPLEVQIVDTLLPTFDTKRQRLDARTTLVQAQVEKPVEWLGVRHRLTGGLEAGAGVLRSRWECPTEGEASCAAGAGDVPQGERVSDGRGRRILYALYAQDQLALTGRVGLSLGARFDRFDDEFDERVAADRGHQSTQNAAVSPKLGMTWSYRNDGTLFLQSVRGFRAPTLEQLYDGRQPFGGSLSNGRLAPQKATSYEAGIHQSLPGAVDLEFSAYAMRLRREIEFDPATFQFENIGRSRHRGAELAVSGRAGALRWFVNSSVVRSIHEGLAEPGKQIKFVPRYLGSAGARYGTSRGWIGSLVYRIVGRQFLDDENEVPLESYSTLDAQVGYRWSRIELTAGVLNLLDSDYATNGFVTPRFVAAPGPSLGPTVMIYPAPERSYRVGLRWALGRH